MKNDKVTLRLPSKTDYVSTVRLTTSSFCNQIGFNVEELEDTRVAISEACNIVMACGSTIEIEYHIKDDSLEITVDAGNQCVLDKEDFEFAQMILETLMDSVQIVENKVKLKKTKAKDDGN